MAHTEQVVKTLWRAKREPLKLFINTRVFLQIFQDDCSFSTLKAVLAIQSQSLVYKNVQTLLSVGGFIIIAARNVKRSPFIFHFVRQRSLTGKLFPILVSIVKL